MSLDKITGHYFIPIATGGAGTALVNTGVSAVYSGEISAPFTATQKNASSWSALQIIGGGYGDPWASGATWGEASGAIAFALRTPDATATAGGYYDVSATTGYQSYWPIMTKSVNWDGSDLTLMTGTGTTNWDGSGQFGYLDASTPIYFFFRNPRYASQVTKASFSDGAGELPYPDRPSADTVTPSMSASSVKWFTNANAINTSFVDQYGGSSAGTSYSVNSAELPSYSYLTGRLSAYFTSHGYPSTAYTFSAGSTSINNTGGSGWR